MTARDGVDLDAVTVLVQQVAWQVVLPRFRRLAEGEVMTKGADDVVTVVDTEAEAAVVAGLADLAPGVPVVGEEQVAADPRHLGLLATSERVFVVDPIDGTRAFVDGRPDFAVMVALVEGGVPVAGWICLPALGHTWVVEQGAGAYRDGARLPELVAAEPVRGGVSTHGLPAGVVDGLGARVRAGGLPALTVGGPLWAGRSYSRLADGEVDALAWGRSWPWDHAAGAVLVREIGGVVRTVDGADYRPTGAGGPLVAAADHRTWRRVTTALALGS